MEQDYDRSFTLFFSPAFIICWLAIVIFLLAHNGKFTKGRSTRLGRHYSYLQYLYHAKLAANQASGFSYAYSVGQSYLFDLDVNMLSKVSGKMKDLPLAFFS